MNGAAEETQKRWDAKEMIKRKRSGGKKGRRAGAKRKRGRETGKGVYSGNNTNHTKLSSSLAFFTPSSCTVPPLPLMCPLLPLHHCLLYIPSPIVSSHSFFLHSLPIMLSKNSSHLRQSIFFLLRLLLVSFTSLYFLLY